MIVKLLIGVEPHCATTAFDVDTSVVVEILLADALLALAARHSLRGAFKAVGAVLPRAHLEQISKQ